MGYTPNEGKIVDAEMHEADLENDTEGLKRIVQGVTKRTLDGKKEENKERHSNIEALEERLREREKKIEELNRVVQEVLTEIKKEKEEMAEEKRTLSAYKEGGEWKESKRRKKQEKPPQNAADKEGRRQEEKVVDRKPRKNRSEDEKRAVQDQREEEPTEVEEGKKERRPPPIVVREEGKLKMIREEAEKRGISIAGCRSTKEGIKIFTKESDDFRELRDLLKSKEVQMHTYSLREEKALKVVLRGIPKEIRPEEVEEDLRDMGFPVLGAKRMKRFKEDLPMVLVDLEKSEEGKKIFGIREVVGMKVKAEPKRKPTVSSQCYRCQMFGHVQYKCTAQYKCMRCAEDHPSFECPKKGKRFTPTCANCGGEHHAASKECEAHPIRIKERIEEEKKKKLERATRKNEVSYAKIAAGGVEEEKTDTLSQFVKLAEEIAKMLPLIKNVING